jgi:hypothetical protein
MDPPLALRFVLRAGSDVPALIATERGDLSLFNLDIKPAEGTFVRNPPFLLQTQGGSLALYRCKLQTPLALNGLKGLLSFQGSGQPEKDKTHSCLLTECVLASGQAGLLVSGPGAVVAIQRSLVLTGGPGIDFEPGTVTSSRLALSYILEDSTFCSKRSVLAVGPITAKAPIAEPLVIQSRNCLFLNPFGPDSSPALLHARGSTLADGLILWQSDEDFVDARIPRLILVGEDKPDAVHLTPARAWGTDSQRKSVPIPGLKATLDPKTWTPLDPLVLPPRLPGLGNRKPGADLMEIGAVKKKRP